MNYITNISNKAIVSVLTVVIAICINLHPINAVAVDCTQEWQYSNKLHCNYKIGAYKELPIENLIKFDVQKSVYFPVVAYPIIKGDNIIVMDAKGSIIKFNNKEKKVVWKNELLDYQRKLSKGYLNGGIADHKGKIYATYGTNEVRCIDAKTGKLVWKKNIQKLARAYPLVSGGKVFIQTLNNGLYALDIKNGTTIWHRSGLESEASGMDAMSPILHGEIIIVQNDYGNIAFIDIETGLETWVFNNDHDGKYRTKGAYIYQALQKDGYLYFYTDNGYAYKLNIEKKDIIWKKQLSISRSMYIAKNKMIAIGGSNNLLAIDIKNGALLWDVSLEKYQRGRDQVKNNYWNSPVVANGIVYVLNAAGDLLQFNLLDGQFFKLISKDIDKWSYLSPIHFNHKIFIN